jgi:heme A synthase
MRPAAFLTFNIIGLLIIGGLLEEPRLAAMTLILIGFALPAGLAYEVQRARLDRAVAVAMGWWSAPFVVLLICYLLDGGLVLTLGCGLAASLLCHRLRLATAPQDEPIEADPAQEPAGAE